MRSETRLRFVVICAAIVLFYSAYAMAGTWQTLDYPGSADTWVEGAGNGYICGYSYSGGYTYDGSTWRTYNATGYPWPTMVTSAWGNTVVGHIQDASGHHGVIYDGATWTKIDKPGSTSTIFYGTNGSVHVGEYYASGSHGFIYNGTTWTTIDKPGAALTFVNGIYGNKIFGRADIYEEEVGGYGFIYDGTAWTDLIKPGAHYTEIKGISGKYIVGNYMQPSNVWHGFLYDGSTWTTMDMPWSTGIIAGITGDTIVGYYNDAGLRAYPNNSELPIYSKAMVPLKGFRDKKTKSKEPIPNFRPVMGEN